MLLLLGMGLSPEEFREEPKNATLTQKLRRLMGMPPKSNTIYPWQLAKLSPIPGELENQDVLRAQKKNHVLARQKVEAEKLKAKWWMARESSKQELLNSMMFETAPGTNALTPSATGLVGEAEYRHDLAQKGQAPDWGFDVIGYRDYQNEQRRNKRDKK